MKKRYFLIAAVLLGAFGLWQIYQNNQEAVRQTKAIIAADQSATDITAATATLQDFVRSHMGASVSYELAGSYQRAVLRAQESAQPDVNSALYQQATAACPTKDPVAQAKCIQSYVSAQPAAQVKAASLPSEAVYKRQITSPGWAPDLAGLSLLTAGTLLVLVLWLWLVDILSKRF